MAGDEEVDCDPGGEDSLGTPVWSHVSVCALLAIRDGGGCGRPSNVVTLYLLSSTVSEREEGSNRKLIASVALTAGGLIGFLVKRYAGFQGG